MCTGGKQDGPTWETSSVVDHRSKVSNISSETAVRDRNEVQLPFDLLRITTHGGT